MNCVLILYYGRHEPYFEHVSQRVTYIMYIYYNTDKGMSRSRVNIVSTMFMLSITSITLTVGLFFSRKSIVCSKVTKKVSSQYI